MKVIILAGGGGTRLFPLSRKSRPKQFLSVDKEESLLGETIARFKGIVRPEDIVIVTNKAYYHHVQTELLEAGVSGANVVLEPQSKNTAPAIALAVKFCQTQLNSNDDEVMFISTSDHIIRPAVTFHNAVIKAEELAKKGKFVTFGILPTKPETGFGYIETGKDIDGALITSSFKEKPDLETAERYIVAGNYFWNSGMFAFRIDTYISELKNYAQDVFEHIHDSFVETVNDFCNMPDISIDYAVAEKSKIGVTLPLKLYWNDVGSWDAIYDVLDKDEDGNAIKGDVVTINCKDNLILGETRLIAGIGLKDIMIVETDDVILIAQKGESQQVKNLVNELQKRGRKEAVEHTTLYYKWGHQSVLGTGKNYKMKQLVIRPGESIESKMHYHRSVHWVVIQGAAEVIIDGEAQMLHDNESVFIPKTTYYSINNPGKISLILIEVENGEYLDDDDIVIKS